MSKNFEEEYRQMIDSELPDLWDRIEAQLPKTAAAVSEEVVTVGSSRHFRNRWMPAVITMAAALLFVIAALPVLFFPRGKESSMRNESAGAADYDGTMMADDAGEYYGAENGCSDGKFGEEPAAEPLLGIQSMFGDSDCATETAESSMAQDTAQDAADYAPTNGASSVEEMEMEPEEAAMNSEEIPDLYQVEVQIIDCILKEEGEIFYEAAVLQNGVNGSQKGIRVYFRCAREGEAQSDGADVSLRQGEKYILSLYVSDETLESYGIESRDGELYGEEMYIVYEVVLK
ncbi:MAG: anti-sigma factor [Lachnospiraceae bacterium]|nr:anti-sigma factor [Lachnospiraceae bacterium]